MNSEESFFYIQRNLEMFRTSHRSVKTSIFCQSQCPPVQMANVKYCVVRLLVSCLFLVSVWHSALTPSLCHPDEFKSFLKRLPSTHFLPISSVHLLWGSDWDLQARYRLLQSSLEIQRLKIQRTARKLFGLSIRCHHNPNHQMPRERWVEI